MTGDGIGDASSVHDEQFNQVLSSLMRAIDAGEHVDPEQWCRHYPNFSGELREFFAKNERLEELVRPLRQVAAKVLHVRCPHCHNPIELLDEAPLSNIGCPSCGSSFSLVGPNATPHDPTPKSFGHFDLIDQVGIGQFGSVWKARDTKLDRIVAIKIPRNGRMGTAETEMFLRDARAAAQLRHPNIVGVHEVGRQDDTVYIVSDFIQGMTLKEWSQANRLTPGEAAELCIKIAIALHHAHEAGVIHRDLKPGNIMMDSDGEPHVVDFGLAKREAGEVTMTVEGQILGTPAYMSPEQARGEGHNVDRRADIYSLGVILFELLTKELPFRGDKQMLIVQILSEEPPSPRRLNSLVARDLETICLKCLEKNANHRYGTTRLVADDLVRFLRSQPINARPNGKLERAWRWCKRNPSVASLAGLLFALLATVAVVGFIVSFYQSTLRRRAEELADRNTTLVGQLSELLVEERTQSQLARLGAYNLQLARAREMIPFDTGQSRELLDDATICLPELRDFTWRVLRQWADDRSTTLQAHSGPILDLAMAANGTGIVSATSAEIKIWDPTTLAPIATIQSKLEEPPFQGPALIRFLPVSFSPNSQLLAFGDGATVKLWNADSQLVAATLSGHAGFITSLAFSPDGTMLASASRDKTVRIWILSAPTSPLKLQGHHESIDAVAFSPDGKKVASASKDKTVRLWDSRTGEELSTFAGGRRAIRLLAFAPNGKTLMGIGERAITWDLDTGRKRDLASTADGMMITNNTVFPTDFGDVAYGIDGNTLAHVDNAMHLFLWDVARTTITTKLTRHRGATISAVAFSDDFTTLVAGDHKGAMHIWKREHQGAPSRFNAIDEIAAVAFTRSGDKLAIAGDGKIAILDTSTGLEERIVPGVRYVTALAYSPDGSMLISGAGSSIRGELVSWSPSTGEILWKLDQRRAIESIVFSKRGRVFATAHGKEVALWEAATRNKLFSLGGFDSDRHGLRMTFTADGNICIADARSISVWNSLSGKRLAKHDGFGFPLAFSHDGKMLATHDGNDPWTVVLWDWAARRRICTYTGHAEQVDLVAFAHDGKTIASGGWETAVRLWDPVTGQQRALLPSKQNAIVTALSFSPDGLVLASGSSYGGLMLWRAPN